MDPLAVSFGFNTQVKDTRGNSPRWPFRVDVDLSSNGLPGVARTVYALKQTV